LDEAGRDQEDLKDLEEISANGMRS